MLAFYYRHQGPVRPVSSWENETDEDEEETQEEELNEELTPEEDQNFNHIEP